MYNNKLKQLVFATEAGGAKKKHTHDLARFVRSEARALPTLVADCRDA